MTPTSKSPAAIVVEGVSRWLVVPDEIELVAPLVWAIANRLPGPAVWLIIVAPPSSGKTELIGGVSALNGVRPLSDLTARTFVSGMKRGQSGAAAPSLLERLNTSGVWGITVKDLGTLLSADPVEKGKIWAQLREIYDGKYDKAYGTGEEVSWKGKLGILAGATTAVDQQQRFNSDLGQRFLLFRSVPADPSRVAMRAATMTAQERERHAAIQAAYAAAVQAAGRKSAISSRTTISEGEADLIAQQLALLVAEARRVVKRDKWHPDDFEITPAEGPGRLTMQLAQVLKAAAIAYGGDYEAAVRFTARVALDSLPGKRGQLLRAVACPPYGITAAQAASLLGVSESNAVRELQDLVELRLFTKNQPARTAIYTASPQLLDAATLVSLDYFDPEMAFKRLFEPPVGCERHVDSTQPGSFRVAPRSSEATATAAVLPEVQANA